MADTMIRYSWKCKQNIKSPNKEESEEEKWNIFEHNIRTAPLNMPFDFLIF